MRLSANGANRGDVRGRGLSLIPRASLRAKRRVRVRHLRTLPGHLASAAGPSPYPLPQGERGKKRGAGDRRPFLFPALGKLSYWQPDSGAQPGGYWQARHSS